MNLAIDVGNSHVKYAVFSSGQIIDSFCTPTVTVADIENLSGQYPGINAAIIMSGRGDIQDIEKYLYGKVEKLIVFDSSVPVPIKNLYNSPALGPDRLAAAVAANNLYPRSNIMVVDFGTAITIDMVTERGEYLGGNISPGAGTRFQALNQFTGKLPLCTLSEEISLTASDSQGAIRSGVAMGIIYEIEGYIRDLNEKYENLKIVFTGGESDYFVKKLKNTIFANYDLVLYGLNQILEYNAQSKH